MQKINFKVTKWISEPDTLFNPFRTNLFSASYDGIGDPANIAKRYIRNNTGGLAASIEIINIH